MDNPIQNHAEMKELNYENPSVPPKAPKRRRKQVCRMKDQDTTLSMIVLLLVCLALAALAHVVV